MKIDFRVLFSYFLAKSCEMHSDNCQNYKEKDAVDEIICVFSMMVYVITFIPLLAALLLAALLLKKKIHMLP